MLFLCTVVLIFFLTTPGIYLILRSRLANNLFEAVSTGFFFGFALLVLEYIAFSRFIPFQLTDAFVVVSSFVCMVLLITEIRRQRLPSWITSPGIIHPLLVLFAMTFMGLLAFGDLSWHIDDDLFIHLPNIKRIAMGDIPPHVPYFPDSLLRGHIARVMFVGTVARFLDLRAELALIYVTLAVVPFYIMVYHALAWRLADGNRILSAYCFFGLLFLVSFAVGATAVRAGAITYVWNNNIFAYSHAVFIGWLIERAITVFANDEVGLLEKIQKHFGLIALCIVSYCGLYFVYMSNFLSFSLFLGVLPILVAIFAAKNRMQYFAQSIVLIVVVVLGMVLLQLLISPFLVERIMISLNFYHPKEPMAVIQQATVTFPKEKLFSLCDPLGQDIRFLTKSSLTAQGPSFYLGLSGLMIGILLRKAKIAATSLFGWMIMLWLLLVDMGSFRAETLRLLLMAHIGFGASSGLLIGLAVQHTFNWLDEKKIAVPASLPSRALKSLVAALAASLCLYMGWGSFEKFMMLRHWDVVANVRKMKRIHAKDPENWNRFLNFRRIDFETFQILEKYVRDPAERLLLKVEPDPRFRGDGHPINGLAVTINAAFMTGAGIVGVAQEHGPPRGSLNYFIYDYRASLFWLSPSVDLLRQLAPDWIVVDPQLVSPRVMEDFISLPGITEKWRLKDNFGNERIVFRYEGKKFEPSPSLIRIVEPEVSKVDVRPRSLVSLPVKIETSLSSNQSATQLKIGMAVVDMAGKQANPLDVPTISARSLEGNRFNLCFSMVQPGTWRVFFVDPVTGDRLNKQPVCVTVNE